MFEYIKLKRENRELKRQNIDLQNKLICLGKTLIMENKVAIVPISLFNELWRDSHREPTIIFKKEIETKGEDIIKAVKQ